MSRARVKVCGITTPQDADMAVAAGVDAIGMILHASSPRQITAERAAEIRRVVPPMVSLIGVVVNAEIGHAQRLYDELGLDYLQLHGEESPDYAETLARPFIRAIRARTADLVQSTITGNSLAGAFLLDPYVSGQHGGTGQTLDHSLWPQSSDRPLILAGGLSPDNVAERIRQFQPFAVDLNSGVESAPGVKSKAKVEAALANVLRVA